MTGHLTLSPQRIAGRAVVGGVAFEVGPGVFCPQPETADVAAWAVRECGGARLVVDLCAGGGTLGILVAARLPGAVVHAVERSAEAMPWLERNCAGTGVRPHLGDAATALAGLDGTVDLVVSNPPYVATHELGGVDPAVRDHDPHDSLLAGGDGLDVVRLVVGRAWKLLRPGGILVVEHSDRQGVTAPDVLRGRGFVEVADHRDAEGRDRFATGRRPRVAGKRGGGGSPRR